MHPMEPVELRGRMVLIEPLVLDHAPGLLEAADCDEVFAWLPYPRPADLDQARFWVEDALADWRAARRLPFAVLSAADGSVIGSTSYWDFDTKNAHVEIGSTWLCRSCWRSGCNVEAKLLLMTHAFEALGLERVALRTDILSRSERSRNGESYLDRGRLSMLGGEMVSCIHLDHVRVTRLPESVEGCEECLAIGGQWLHLRICLECGRVGCCDDSPNRHARAHARSSGHPLIRSIEPGEVWSWCFVDDFALLVPGVEGETRIPPSPLG